jgi:hypothetical protein
MAGARAWLKGCWRSRMAGARASRPGLRDAAYTNMHLEDVVVLLSI